MVTLEQVKFQCRIEHDDEDALLAEYMAAARDHVQKHLDRTIYELAVPDDDPDGVIDNPSIDQATLLLISHWYAHREAVSESSMTEMPMGTYHLLQPYRNMGI
ncbi:head-tail connector protein [Psychrobacter sp. JB193]|uniref:head-tail connector protein n=1 Tax=Psychrobacter sp. JB193 TaxID=2024406 RepID=UPI000BAAF2BA|nr:head-tail connector protein [Psychrobacter sp. JB193]PAT64058.1 hypothetical protein CIK80_02800 [Psychrobacter sp. JB193]